MQPDVRIDYGSGSRPSLRPGVRRGPGVSLGPIRGSVPSQELRVQAHGCSTLGSMNSTRNNSNFECFILLILLQFLLRRDIMIWAVTLELAGCQSLRVAGSRLEIGELLSTGAPDEALRQIHATSRIGTY